MAISRIKTINEAYLVFHVMEPGVTERLLMRYKPSEAERQLLKRALDNDHPEEISHYSVTIDGHHFVVTAHAIATPEEGTKPKWMA